MITYIFFIYNPFHYFTIKRENNKENIIFYLYIISDKEELIFLLINKINEHYNNCGICDLCEKYFLYYKIYENNLEYANEEKKQLLERENNSSIITNENIILNLFKILDDGKSKYFILIKNLIMNYKQKKFEYLNNNAHYYINLSFLIYSEFENNNITLSLNEKIILERINQKNVFLENQQIHINYLLFCNEFIDLSNKVIEQLKDIINSEQNLYWAQKLINLSFLLKKMKDKKYYKHIFNNKIDNNYNSKNLIFVCSIIYEEIFNIIRNNSQIPLRENLQQLEDIFHYNVKNDKIISLSLNLNSNNCNIIRAGKELFRFVNTNLFDIFPLIFKQYQINSFLSTILNNFDSLKNDKKSSNSILIILDNHKHKNMFYNFYNVKGK